MGCGCGGKSKVTKVSSPSGASAVVTAGGAKIYDVIGVDGSLVASSANPTFARIEARRTGGTVVPRQATSVSPA